MEEVELGPWDCAMLVPLTGEQCCDMVRWSVPSLDVNGRHIECYFELPEEAEENKVILVWDPTTGTVSYIYLLCGLSCFGVMYKCASACFDISF